VKMQGAALEFASDKLKADEQVVVVAAKNDPSALKFAKDGLNQNESCWRAAGLREPKMEYLRPEKAILSVKFSLAATSSNYATEFALAMKKDPFLNNFQTYNPNFWEKYSCDQDFTNIEHPCRGTLSTCTKPEHENLSKNKRPCPTSCWRVAFRFQQEECLRSNGFMIQVQEFGGLGSGQNIETVMAEQVTLKVFRTYTNELTVKGSKTRFGDEGRRLSDIEWDGMTVISKAVQAWYENHCINRDLETVFVGSKERCI